MPQADQLFKTTFRKHFSNHEANFPPTTPIALGDFGEMKNGYFVRLGNIKQDMGIEFDALPDNDPTYEQFKSDGNVDVSFKAKGDISGGTVPLLKAQVEIKFGSEKAFFFSSANVRYLQIASLFDVGKKLVDLYNTGKWKKRFVLISRVLEGEDTIIVTSGSSNSSITIEAESAEIPEIDLANISGNLKFAVSKSVSYQVIGKTKLQLGFGLSRVYDTIFNKPVFKLKGTLAQEFIRLDNDLNHDAIAFGDIILNEDNLS